MLTVPGGVDGQADQEPAKRIEAKAWLAGKLNASTTARAIEGVWAAAALLVIAALATLKLWMPLHQDTALFLWVAQRLAHGAVLYVDVWDVKQPGIFLFDLLAGKLFGFTPFGVHLLELVWQLAFAGVMLSALRGILRHRWLAAAAPLACLASYYAFCKPPQQTQLEILVGLPLFLSAWATAYDWQSAPGRAAGFFGAGIVAGIATVFKHVLAPIPVAFVIAASIELLRRHGRRSTAALIVQVWGPFSAGVLVVWGTIAAVFWRLGGLPEFFNATFLYPLTALGEVAPAPLSQLAVSLSILAAALAPWLIYATPAVWRIGHAGEPALFGRMGVWLVTGIAVILLQKNAFWAYHMLLLYPPVGVLAARGLDLVLTWLRAAGKLPVMTVSMLLVVPVVAVLAYPAGETARALITPLQEGTGLDGYRLAVSPDYQRAAEATAYLEAHAPPGPIYVFGDPTIMLLSGRDPALSLQGSSWGFYLSAQWQRLPADLEAARPVWIFLDSIQRRVIEQKSPQTMALLAKRYELAWDTPYGRWYALRAAGSTESGSAPGAARVELTR